MKKDEIKIIDLNLWDENPRFPKEYFIKPEKELIKYIFNKKGEKDKIIELSKSIIDNFELVPWERLVVWDNGEKKITLEGNRRLMIYKILINPELVDDIKVKKIFEEGRIKTNIKNNFSVDCLITHDKEIGLRYVELKHLEKGYKGWGESEKNNFKSRRGKKSDEIIIKTSIDEKVKKLDIPQMIKDKVLGQGFVTTFYRIIATSPAKKYFEYEVKDNELLIQKDINFDGKLKQIVWNVINKKVYSELFDEQKEGEKDKLNSRVLNKVENIGKYLGSISSKTIKKAEEEIKESVVESINLFNEKEQIIQTDQGIIRKTAREKDKLDEFFGGNLVLQKGDTNNIYRDILDLYNFYIKNKEKLSKNFPAMIRMSLRLLVESSVTTNIQNYVNKNFDEAKKKLTQDQKTTLSNNGVSGKKALIQLLQGGAHNYTNSANFEQTIAMSIIIGSMLNITHSKKK